MSSLCLIVMIDLSFICVSKAKQRLYKERANLGKPSGTRLGAMSKTKEEKPKTAAALFIVDACTVWKVKINKKYQMKSGSKVKTLSISESLTHILVLHRLETVTNNLQDLSAALGETGIN